MFNRTKRPIIDYDNAKMIESSDLFITPESDTGPIEYKYTLQTGDGDSLYQARASQLNYRLQEGNGLALLYLGTTDIGYQLGLTKERMENSLDNLEKILEIIDGQIDHYELFENKDKIENNFKQLYLSYNTPLAILNDPTPKERKIEEDISFMSVKEVSTGWTACPIADNLILEARKFILKMSIRRNLKINREIRIVVLGSVDAGKSSLIGVLSSNKLDNGNGSARSLVFTHRHEMLTGRTSSIGQKLLGLTADGKIVNDLRTTEETLIEKSHKLISLIDLAGHLKYLNTTVRGVCGHFPDRALIVIDGGKTNAVTPMTKEHIVLAYLQKLPMTIVFTKIDKAAEEIYEKNYYNIKTLLKTVNYNLLHVKNQDDLEIYHRHPVVEMVPFFAVSNVLGQNIDLLIRHFHQLSSKNDFAKKILEPFSASINETFTVQGVGTVVSTIVLSGTAEARQLHWIGPFTDGRFRKVSFKSIQYKRTNVNKCIAGQAVTISLRGVDRSEILKGMVLTAQIINSAIDAISVN